jgi:transcriptional regulator with XRE-family HTH domain
MIEIGRRIRQLREAKGLSQRTIEKRTGILRCNVSRYESAYMVPTLDTLKKLAKAMGVPLWEVLAGTDVSTEPAQAEPLAPYETKLFGLLKKIGETDRVLFLSVANKMSAQGERKHPSKKLFP